jgi:hypothetical protein
MDSAVFESSLEVYFEAFAENDKTRRLVLLSRCMTEAGEIWGPQRLFKGYEAISEKIEGFHARMPGARLVLASEGLSVLGGGSTSSWLVATPPCFVDFA